ncbi:hypothetical protein [Streptomyces silvensis]|uniref:Uncharacterized protein n=1 Tax=Streptomyces silvensis TaxID=1765722 RepID=A0A0W7X9C5_9ACTN|nr:hypothetical protein [Streptomyces silvensis]KUF19577.1 hypothetical protein AT728_04175 [Streptomyces silvensis]
MATVIPGALADHLTAQTITDADTLTTLDGARRGRGRTLVIEPASTRVLHVISTYAEAILENRKLHTDAEARAARLWIQRVGHAPAAPAAEAVETPGRDNLADTVICPFCRVGAGVRCITRAGKPARDVHGPRVKALEDAAGITQHRAERFREADARGLAKTLDHKAEAALFATYAARIATPVQAPTAPRDEPSDWWTIMDPATGEEVARVYGETYQDMTPRAEALPEVRAVIRRHKGFSRRRLLTSELTPAQRAEQAEAAEQVAPLTTTDATAGTWRGAWIGEHQAADALFVVDHAEEQGALFDRAAQ